MIGKYRVTVEDKKVRYDFTVKRKYTILQGDSASGKTTLYNMIANPKFNKIEVSSVDSSGLKAVDIIAVPKAKNAYSILFENSKKAIYVVDESVEDYCSEYFIKLMEDTDAYFIIITRKQLVYEKINKKGLIEETHLSYSINEVYELESTVSNAKYVDTFSNCYKVEQLDKSPDIVLTEDSGSGLEILRNVYSLPENCVRTSHGNGKLIHALREIDNEFNNSLIGVFVDGAAYGDQLAQMLQVIEGCKNDIDLYIPESMEWLLLNCIPSEEFNNPFNKDVLDRSYMYCDEEAFATLTENYEHHLPGKVRSWENLYEYYLVYVSSKNENRDRYSKGRKVGPLYLRHVKEIRKFIDEKL